MNRCLCFIPGHHGIGPGTILRRNRSQIVNALKLEACANGGAIKMAVHTICTPAVKPAAQMTHQVVGLDKPTKSSFTAQWIRIERFTLAAKP